MRLISTPADYRSWRADVAELLLEKAPFDRGSVHAQKITNEMMHTKELTYISLSIQIPKTIEQLAELVKPNLPWAEDHFKERISGEPLNPPPSNEWWPFAQRGNEVHKKAQKFSHSYPERFWPKLAKDYDGIDGYEFYSCRCEHPCEVCNDSCHAGRGIRFAYGDYNTLLEVLSKEPNTRQAYLPIWFPEDIQAAAEGERVPCTLGYHFMSDDRGALNLSYPMRSCDFLRFMPDDIYMAGRLLQHTVEQTGELFKVGTLHMSISSLHVFKGDQYALSQIVNS
jgi:thymidylate synthase